MVETGATVAPAKGGAGGGTGAMLDQAATAMAGDGGIDLNPLIDTS